MSSLLKSSLLQIKSLLLQIMSLLRSLLLYYKLGVC